MKCIICRNKKERNELSDEHVIPESIGGHYHIYSVCKKCNSIMGKNIDSKLVNHLLTKYKRYELGLKGKNGNIPNPFEGTHTLLNDDNKKVRLDLDKEGMPSPYILPNTKITKQTNNKTLIQISLDSDDEKNLDTHLNKVLKRNKITDKEYHIEYNKYKDVKKFKPEIKMEQTLDVRDFKIGLLKIAYEFAVDTIPEYFEDENAIKISENLYLTNLENINEYFIGSGFDKNMFEFIKFIDFSKNRHILILIYVKDLGFLCFISLSGIFEIVVKLSKKNYLEQNMIIGINDLTKKKFEKFDIFEFLKKIDFPAEYQFGFSCKDEQESLELQSIMNNSNFRYEMINNSIPLYNSRGEIIYNDIEEKFQNLDKKGLLIPLSSTEHQNTILANFDEELFLKLYPKNKLFKVQACKKIQNTKDYKPI